MARIIKTNRKSDTREQKKSFFIICAEGKNSKTEKNYFDGIKRQLRELSYSARIDIKPMNINNIDDSIIEKYKDYSEKWLIIDKDENDLEGIEAKYKNIYNIGFSNLCFEYWLLLHFEDSHPTQVLGCKKYALNTYIKKYKKNDTDIYKKVEGGEENAIKYAKKNLENWKRSGKKLNDWTSSTNIYELVEKMREIRLSLTIKKRITE